MNRPKTSTILIISSLFVALLIIRFPFQNLKGSIFGKIYKATGIYIIADDIYPSFFGWPGIGMKNVSITAPVGDSELNLECQKLTARAGVAGLFPPAPALSLFLKGLKQGGNLYVRYSPNKQGLRATIEANQLNLAQLSSSTTNPIATGLMTLDGDISVNHANVSLTTGEASLQFQDLVLGAQNLRGIVLAEMTLGQVKAEISAKNAVATISSFQIGDSKSDLQGTLTGEIKLDSSWDNSMLNFALKVKLSPSYTANPDSATITSFLNTFKIAEGEYSIRLNATVSQFIQSSILLLQKGT